ncbi:MAG: UDP diphospho-muramoyl pentapeptide beta-N acetylglucosaminyl transferase [Candidatus Jorgensenbacteria bacterium GW2011_GWF2_41_8]|uniref:UDP diphospho-muramoyl pentapeptide beta-N acetylglucosaminyl transferase n=1 Tax=Candidatus Jorgensenbacteria bacterium GW2011_GWF2_41_8 TaxID=1618667 RepID=A0A0G0XG22_9BACT|nr:MAG: UDP diphospho-muramoyl pentapeptide beta-N acetylglucosaminyl transferase [Candidatus Jorgensenbacteria bacterium GW2011_GWF2_41_8]
MKIVLAGGGTGGHFYPIVAVVEKLNKIAQEKKILELKLYYFSDSPYDQTALFDNDIEFEEINSGKMRTYFSIKNFFDVFKTFFGFWGTLLKIFSIYPDVIFAKGGYLSFPVVLAARVLRIPLIIHESDSVPGRVNLFAGRFARRVAVSFAEAAQFFPKSQPHIPRRLWSRQ